MAEQRTPVERLLSPDPDVEPQLSRTSAQRRRTLEAYFQAGGPPRWMERLAEIERGVAGARSSLARAYEALRAECGDDAAAFARRWRATAAAWPFDPALNVLIGQHNDWYPIERQLAVNPRTGEYVLVHGRSYRRPVLDAAWVLDRFPAERG